MISSSTASGELDPEEQDYLNNVFDFGDTVAREVMVPQARTSRRSRKTRR